MTTVRISPDYEVSRPNEVRDSLGLHPGQEVQVLRYGDRIELIPLKPVEELCGFLAGTDTDVEREPDRV